MTFDSVYLSVIVPTYNEEHGIREFYRRTKAVLNSLQPNFSHEIIFINDFSTDNTFIELEKIADIDQHVRIINFSRNFGNQAAITAGIDNAKGDIAIIIDDDLQDPPELIPAFIKKWEAGYKVVYGVRPNRKGINPVFGYFAKLYYRIIGLLSDTKIPPDTGDFRLIDKSVLDVLRNMREESRYYRGMVSWVGFKQIGIEYERDIRYAGSSTFSIAKYFRFAINGLVSFTDRPLYFSSILGVLITLISFMFLVLLVGKKIMDPSFSIPGWPSLIALVLFFGGIQLLSIGIVSVYISKIYREVKGRPLYVVEETRNIDSKNSSKALN